MYKQSVNSKITRNKHVMDFLAHRVLACIEKIHKMKNDKEWALKFVSFSPVEKIEYTPEELEVRYQDELEFTQDMLSIFKSIYFDVPVTLKSISDRIKYVLKTWTELQRDPAVVTDELKAIMLLHVEILDMCNTIESTEA